MKAFVDGEVEQIVRLIKGEISNLAEFGLDGLTFTLHTYRCILRAIKKASGPLGIAESESLVKMLIALRFLQPEFASGTFAKALKTKMKRVELNYKKKKQPFFLYTETHLDKLAYQGRSLAQNYICTSTEDELMEGPFVKLPELAHSDANTDGLHKATPPQSDANDAIDVTMEDPPDVELSGLSSNSGSASVGEGMQDLGAGPQSDPNKRKRLLPDYWDLGSDSNRQRHESSRQSEHVHSQQECPCSSFDSSNNSLDKGSELTLPSTSCPSSSSTPQAKLQEVASCMLMLHVQYWCIVCGVSQVIRVCKLIMDIHWFSINRQL